MKRGVSVAEKEKAGEGKVSGLEYRLDAAEEELDMAAEKIPDEASKK